MPTSLQIVDPDNLAQVLFDLNDQSGASNPGRVATWFGVRGAFKLSPPDLEATRFSPAAAPGGFTTVSREGLAEASWLQRMTAPSYDALMQGAGVLQRLIRNGGVLRWLPEGSAFPKYIDAEPSTAHPMWQGNEMEIHQLTHLFETPMGAPIVLWRQPHVRGVELDPAVNVLINPLMLLDFAVTGRPDGWTWVSTSNISAEAISAPKEAYSFATATTGSRTLRSTQYVGAAISEVWSGQIEVSASDSSTARAAVQITALATDGTTVTGTYTGAAVQLSSNPQRLTVTTAALPASTVRVRLDLVMTNLAATSVTVYATKAQLEKAPTPTLFVRAPATVRQDPALSGGRGGFVWIHGDAPAPVRLEMKSDASSKLTDLFVGVRGSEGVKGRNSVAQFGQGAHYLQLESGTLSNDTTAVHDDNASTGAGNNVAECAYTTNPTVLAKRVRKTTTAFLDSLRGPLRIYMRCKASNSSYHTIQLRWGPSAGDPPPYSLDEVAHDTTDATGSAYVDKYLGTIFVPKGTDLSQLTFEIHSRRDSGSGGLRMDFLSLIPADRFGRLTLPSRGEEQWLGNQLITPTSPNTLTAGDTFSDSTIITLDTINNAAATPPTGGVAYGAVRNVWDVDVQTHSTLQVGNKIGEIRVRNVTDGTNDLVFDVNRKAGQTLWRRTKRLQFDGVAGKAYQVQVVYTSATTANEYINVFQVRHSVAPFVAQNEWIRSDPVRATIEHLSTTKTFLSPVNQDGQTLLWLDPGLNFIAVFSADITSAGYNEPKSVISRDPEVRFVYSPRFWQ